MKKQNTKLMATSKVFTEQTVEALNRASGDTAAAIAAACLDGARVGITRDRFLEELRRVTQIPCNTAAASCGLRAAGVADATLASVAEAITEQYEKDRQAAVARRKAAKKPPAAPSDGGEQGENDGEQGADTDTGLSGLTLSQLETRRDALRAELAQIDARIRAMKAAAAAAATPAMGDAAVGGC